MWFCESIRRPREASSEANSDIGWGPHDSTNPSKDSSDDSTTRRRWRPFRLTRGRCRFERHTSARRLKRPRRRVQGQLISLLGTRMAAPPCFRLDAKPRRQTSTPNLDAQLDIHDAAKPQRSTLGARPANIALTLASRVCKRLVRHQPCRQHDACATR